MDNTVARSRKTLWRSHNTVVSAANPEAPAVPSDNTVATAKVFLPIISSTLVCSDPVKRLSGDPSLIKRPLLRLLVLKH